MPPLAWILIAGVIAAAGLGILHALALAICRETRLHDLKVHVANLRISYIEEAARVGHEFAPAERPVVVDVVHEPRERKAA